MSTIVAFSDERGQRERARAVGVVARVGEVSEVERG